MLELSVSDHSRCQLLACEALILDMDGTLIDSRACVAQAWRSWCLRHGLDLDELLRISHGRQNDEIVRLVAPHLDTADELAHLARAEEDCRDGIVAVPGARRLLEQLGSGRWAVVTSAWRRLAVIRLGCAGLPVPAVLVAADEIRRGKPHPEGYLRAAARLKVEPSKCVAVEDAPAGIAAARAAGMRVVGITTTVRRAELECEWCVDDLSSLTVRALPATGPLPPRSDSAG